MPGWFQVDLRPVPRIPPHPALGQLKIIIHRCHLVQGFKITRKELVLQGHVSSRLSIMATSKQQVIRSEGMFHGLPTYTKSEPGLIAIITGANGISGYHMVKVLAAAPERWKKIYCLSRRPPPDYFFDGLGEGASRVEHVSADFLDEPSSIAKTLKGRVDHV